MERLRLSFRRAGAGGPHSVTLAVGIVGATVMPHAIYLHSSLTKDRMPVHNDFERHRVLRFSNSEVLVALGLAGLVNMAMIAMAAAVFHQGGHNDVAEIETAYRTLIPLLGRRRRRVHDLASGFGVFELGRRHDGGAGHHAGLRAFHHTLVGPAAGDDDPGLHRRRLGVNSTQALVMSQVVLSIVLPVPMVALLLLTSRRDVMGGFVNKRLTTVVAVLAAALVLALNLLLLAQAAGIAIPYLPLE